MATTTRSNTNQHTDIKSTGGFIAVMVIIIVFALYIRILIINYLSQKYFDYKVFNVSTLGEIGLSLIDIILIYGTIYSFMRPPSTKLMED